MKKAGKPFVIKGRQEGYRRIAKRREEKEIIT